MEPLNHPNQPETGKTESKWKALLQQQKVLVAAIAVIVLLAAGFAYQSWKISKIRTENPASAINAGSDAQGAGQLSDEKSALIETILQINKALDSTALAELSAQELRQLQAAGAPGIPIGLSTAAYAAEEYAGTLEMDSITWTGEPDIDDRLPHYEIELHHPEQGDFDYEVDAFTGEILKGSKNIFAPPIIQEDPDSDMNGLVSLPYGDTFDIPEGVEVDGGISLVQAKKLALYDVGILEEDTDYCDVKLEYEGGRPECFEVDFAANGIEYEYEIDPYNGGILKSSQKTGYIPPAPEQSQTITAEQAASIAYSEAGVEASDVTSLKTKLDWDDGIRIYEVEFVSGDTRYEYELDAANGSIRKSEQKAASRAPAGTSVQDVPASYTYIDAAAAKNAAFQHAGVSAGDAREIECELDEDHGLSRYEIEFKVGRLEYEYEVDAVTGVILKAEKDS